MITSGIVITTSAQHGYADGEPIFISDTSTAAVGIANDTYYVKVLNVRQFVLYYDSALTSVVNYDIGNDYTGSAEVMSKSAPEGTSGLYTQPSAFTADGRGGSIASGGISNLSYTVTSNVQNFSVSSALVQVGWDGVSPTNAIITINAGVYVWSNTTSTAAFVLEALPDGSSVFIINNGYIIGRGGNGGSVPTSSRTGTTGSAGGPAMDINYSVSITNNSYIAGGGGGGGSVYGDHAGGSYQIVRGGGAGGAGGGNGSGGAVGGSVGSTGSNGSSYHGGAGGRILPGTGGATAQVGAGGGIRSGQGGGAGGSGGGVNDLVAYAPPQIIVTGGVGGGGGGGWGASGGLGHYAATGGFSYYTIPGAGGSANNNGGNGSGLPSPTYPNITTASGGAGGKAVNLNGNTVTWVATGTRYGAIS